MTKRTKNLRSGDIILALDGHKLKSPVRVTRFVETLDDGTAHVEVEQPKEWMTTPDRWLRHETAEVARPVTIAGVKLWKIDDDTYRTPDGVYEVYRDHGHVTECEDKHPVKLTWNMVRHIREHPGLYCFEAQHAADMYGQRIWDDRRQKYRVVRGYMCYGGEEHGYSQWVAYFANGDAIDSCHWSDTVTEATSYLADYIKENN